jgi:glycosyltransferase involved in cell wall biosynthesis
MMKIGIFTSRSTTPMHPRLEAFTEYFRMRGIDYDIIPLHNHFFFSRLNWLYLHFFDFWSVLRNMRKLRFYDIIFIQDLKYLPLARFAKLKKKKVIYEALDNNVYLREYNLEKRFPVFSHFRESIIRSYIRREKNLALRYCDIIIVNSKALKEYFNNMAHILFYYSSFESIDIVNNGNNIPALLYLGTFSHEKGAGELIELQKKLDLDLFIYGTVSDHDLQKEVDGSKKIHHTERISHDKLWDELKNLLLKYFLFGASLINPVNYSYATQEANKDIDYLSLGIPLIGNHRKPTEEKILSGCGVFIEKEDDLQNLLSDENFRTTLSNSCRKYYFMNYSKEKFLKGLERILEF